MEVSEIGFTKDIISTIRNHSNRIPNYGVWANPGYNENIFGGDIDIFVETIKDSFVWYALQAKALQMNQRYEGLNTSSNGGFQWDKLHNLYLKAGCKTAYLLYNGVDQYKYSGLDSCNNPFNESQYGCSIISVEEFVRHYKLGKTSFKDYHPDYAEPWRVIVCCPQKLDGIILYDTTVIKQAISYYPESFGGAVDSIESASEGSSNVDTNSITSLSAQMNRTPYYRIVIRTTQGLKNIIRSK